MAPEVPVRLTRGETRGSEIRAVSWASLFQPGSLGLECTCASH